jgi:hypothetical protein
MRLKMMLLDLTEQLTLQCSEPVEIDLYREYTRELYRYGRKTNDMGAVHIQRSDGNRQRVGDA